MQHLMKHMLLYLGLSLVVLAGYASAQSSPDVTGTWVGSTLRGAATLTMVLQQTGNRVTGTIVGAGTESADDWIAEHAPELARAHGRLWLVTSDRELRRRVEDVVERLLGGGSFAGTLMALEREPR